MSKTEQQLHSIARRAHFDGRPEDAMKCYKKCCDDCEHCSGHSYLRCAQCLEKLKREEEARNIFAMGVLANRKQKDEAMLMQAWGLFESKQGEMRKAYNLVKRAAVLDPSKIAVLRWSKFRAAGAARCAPATMSVAATAMVEVAQPACQYTVKQANRGWRGRADAGEDPAKWYDSEGLRNGPPANYWRQAMDERRHRDCMAALAAVASDDESQLAPLESRMGIRRPMRNRKLYGRWAPLVANGQRVARAEEAGAYVVPAMIDIFRTAGRKTYDHRYGTIDEHPEEGEDVTYTLVGEPQQEGGAAPRSATLAATEVNERRALESLELPGAGELQIGGITLLNDYMMVARSADGQLQDVFMRVDVDLDE